LADEGSAGFRVALANADYRKLLAGLAISETGDWLYGVALIAFVFEATRSPAWLAAATILRLAPYVIFGAVGGVVADRFDRRWVMIWSDLIRAAAMAGLTLTAVSSAPIAIALALAFISTIASTAYLPALTAITPKVVGERELAPANALMSSIDHIALVVGPSIGAVLLLLGSPATAFAANGASFLVSAFFVWRMRTDSRPTEGHQGEASLRQRIAEGLAAITSSSEVAVLVILVSAATFVYGGELVVLVLISERFLGLGAEGIGWLTAAVGAGGVVAAGLTSRLANNPRPTAVIGAAVLAAGLPLPLLAFVRAPAVAVVLLVVEGAGSIVLDVVSTTAIQRIVPNEVAARVFGLIDSVAVAAILVGSLVTPVLVEYFGLQATLLILGAVVVAILIASLPRIRAVDRASAKQLRALAPRVALLKRIGVFAGAPQSTLESLARSGREHSVGPGTDVVREGEGAEELFVVASGTLVVTSSGESLDGSVPVNELHAGDYFGEIGLIEGIPRTATVTASSQAELLVIPGDDFLELVNGRAAIRGALLDGVVSRLARTHPTYVPGSSQSKEAS
jgi:MFS family permease